MININANILMARLGGGGAIQVPSIISDGNTIARFDRTLPSGVVKDVNGKESIWWDLMAGSSQRGAEESSGNIILYAVYEITATQANFFYTGCQVGDIFPCGAVKTLSASNKVKRVLGNHLTQPDINKRPVNGLFDPANSCFMASAPVTFNQPNMVYCVFKPITHSGARMLFNGATTASSAMAFYQTGVSADRLMRANAGTELGGANVAPTLNEWHITRNKYNGASSYIQLDGNSQVIGNAGTNNAGRLIVSSNYLFTGAYINAEYKDLVFRNIDETNENAAIIYDWLQKKNKLSYPNNDIEIFYHTEASNIYIAP